MIIVWYWHRLSASIHVIIIEVMFLLKSAGIPSVHKQLGTVWNAINAERSLNTLNIPFYPMWHLYQMKIQTNQVENLKWSFDQVGKCGSYGLLQCYFVVTVVISDILGALPANCNWRWTWIFFWIFRSLINRSVAQSEKWSQFETSSKHPFHR